MLHSWASIGCRVTYGASGAVGLMRLHAIKVMNERLSLRPHGLRRSLEPRADNRARPNMPTRPHLLLRSQWPPYVQLAWRKTHAALHGHGPSIPTHPFDFSMARLHRGGLRLSPLALLQNVMALQFWRKLNRLRKPHPMARPRARCLREHMTRHRTRRVQLYQAPGAQLRAWCVGRGATRGHRTRLSLVLRRSLGMTVQCFGRLGRSAPRAIDSRRPCSASAR
mmetsp:Transcript_3240/g.9953  ORF Transcript_3240/g.9953 Transcript_3240/m.9953 type:complete len:223 (+) Transcript_3240:1029-1697(+)